MLNNRGNAGKAGEEMRLKYAITLVWAIIGAVLLSVFYIMAIPLLFWQVIVRKMK